VSGSRGGAPALPAFAVTPLTSAHPGGIGAVVVWGAGAGARMRALFPELARDAIALLRPTDAGGGAIDEVVALRVPAARAPTGEEEFELDFHGGRVARERVRAFLAAHGAEELPVERYAACARSLDAAGREAMVLLRGATSAEQTAFLLRQVRGELGRVCAGLCAAAVDAACARGLAALRAQERVGRALVEGARVLVVGPPNSGKSTLVNRLAGAPRAIVSEIPGTTRDLLEAAASIEGVPVTFIDSCGLTSNANALEALGAQRVRAEIPRADCVLCLGIAPEALPVAPRAALALGPKADLGCGRAPGVLPVSGATGLGLETLRERVHALVCGGGDWRRPAPFTERHGVLLAKAAEALEGGDRALCNEIIFSMYV
jgi:tRNA modification GTPase